MIRPDIIISWPRNCDYPLWRQYIHDHRANFNEIIVVFTETNYGDDYRQFLHEVMFGDHILCLDNPTIGPDEDWRDVAIHSALLHSYNAPWVLFTEQDFIMEGEFWTWVNAQEGQGYDAMVVKDSGRIHPCCILIKREAFNKTRKEFGVVKDRLDHFGLFQEDLENPANGIKLAVFPSEYYYHYNGLSHNISLIARGELPNWGIDAFNLYFKKTLRVSVPLDERYKKMVYSYFEKVG